MWIKFLFQSFQTPWYDKWCVQLRCILRKKESAAFKPQFRQVGVCLSLRSSSYTGTCATAKTKYSVNFLQRSSTVCCVLFCRFVEPSPFSAFSFGMKDLSCTVTECKQLIDQLVKVFQCFQAKDHHISDLPPPVYFPIRHRTKTWSTENRRSTDFLPKTPTVSSGNPVISTARSACR